MINMISIKTPSQVFLRGVVVGGGSVSMSVCVCVCVWGGGGHGGGGYKGIFLPSSMLSAATIGCCVTK